MKTRLEALRKAMCAPIFAQKAPISVINSKESLQKMIKAWKVTPSWLGFDTETIGLDALETYKTTSLEGDVFEVDTAITSIQYFDGLTNYFINIPIMYQKGLQNELRDFLKPIHASKDVHITCYNAVFDLQMMLVWGVFTEQVNCLLLGARAMRRHVSDTFVPLKTVALHLVKYDMDKEIRETFLCDDVRNGIFTDDQIKYAVIDAEIMAPLYYQTVKRLGASNELDSWKLSNMNLIGTAFLMLGGIPIDAKRLDTAIAENDKYIYDLELEKIKRGLDVYNFNSHIQIKKMYLTVFNIELPNTSLKTLQGTLKDAKTSKGTYSEEQIDTMEYIVRYRERNTKLAEKKIKVVKPKFMQLDYRGLDVFTYNLITDGARTGRHTSSGSKKISKKRLAEGNIRNDQLRINAANVSGTIRPCTRVPKGFKVIGADFTSIEVFIIMCYAGEDGQIKAVNEGLDIHKYAASIVEQIDYDKVTPKQRQAIKGVVFKMLYGGSAKTDEEKEAQTRYFEAFPKMKKYLKDRLLEAKLCGYVRLVSGKRRYLSSSSPTCDMYGYRKSLREALNAPMQGGCADIIKHSLATMTRELYKQGLLWKVLGGAMVYDELMLITTDELATKVAKIMGDAMTEALTFALPKIKRPVMVDIARHWAKSNYEDLVRGYVKDNKYDNLHSEVKKTFGVNSNELEFIEVYKDNKEHLTTYLDNYKGGGYKKGTIEERLYQDII
jgi:DNA polymerase I-like protein with 3'-5' exonuclease and polymerase domains